jgi:hypothetical protein
MVRIKEGIDDDGNSSSPFVPRFSGKKKYAYWNTTVEV